MPLLRRVVLLVALSIACAALALAEPRSGTNPDDSGPPAPRTSLPASAPVHVSAPVALPLTPGEDSVPSLQHNPPPAPAALRFEHPGVASEQLGPHGPLPADRPADRRAPHKRTPGTTVRSAPPPAQRAKAGPRQLPATPGMGTLLRFGITVGKEVSWNVSDEHGLQLSA